MKIWCVAHRANLTFGDLSNKNSTVSEMISVLSKISSYFHTSGLRTAELKEIANKNVLKLLSMPKIFEICWVEFTYNLFKAILTNWNALVLFFAEYPDAQGCGFRYFLTTVEKLKLITFFADLLFVYQRFHKRMQLDSLTLPVFCQYVQNVTKTLTDLKINPITGGFEHTLSKQMENKNEKFYIKNIQLSQQSSSRRQILEIGEMRKKIIDLLISYLNVRMERKNSDLMEAINSFLKFEKSFDISKIHHSFQINWKRPRFICNI